MHSALFWLIIKQRLGDVKMNIFVEGIQGSGKSTMVQRIHEWHPEFLVCREGDYSPVELAWCSLMTRDEYRNMLERYSSIREEIEEKTIWEENHAIVLYTRILTDIPGFHKDLEQWEIYNGRRSLGEIQEIITRRYKNFREDGYLFECSFFQNIIEELILYNLYTDDQIVDFYRNLFEVVDHEYFMMIYLQNDNLEESINHIRIERSDGEGNELWFPMMMGYYCLSPYGLAHGCRKPEDLIAHFEHRQRLELRIIREVLQGHVVILPAKQWNREDVETWIGV